MVYGRCEVQLSAIPFLFAYRPECVEQRFDPILGRAPAREARIVLQPYDHCAMHILHINIISTMRMNR